MSIPPRTDTEKSSMGGGTLIKWNSPLLHQEASDDRKVLGYSPAIFYENQVGNL